MGRKTDNGMADSSDEEDHDVQIKHDYPCHTFAERETGGSRGLLLDAVLGSFGTGRRVDVGRKDV